MNSVRAAISLSNDIVDRNIVLNYQLRSCFYMEVNDLGFVATILFVLVPTVFLLILFIQTDKDQREG